MLLQALVSWSPKPKAIWKATREINSKYRETSWIFSRTRTAPLFPPFIWATCTASKFRTLKAGHIRPKSICCALQAGCSTDEQFRMFEICHQVFYGRAVLMVSDCQTALTLTCYLQWLGVLHFIVEEDFLYYFIQKFWKSRVAIYLLKSTCVWKLNDNNPAKSVATARRNILPFKCRAILDKTFQEQYSKKAFWSYIRLFWIS